MRIGHYDKPIGFSNDFHFRLEIFPFYFLCRSIHVDLFIKVTKLHQDMWCTSSFGECSMPQVFKSQRFLLLTKFRVGLLKIRITIPRWILKNVFTWIFVRVICLEAQPFCGLLLNYNFSVVLIMFLKEPFLFLQAGIAQFFALYTWFLYIAFKFIFLCIYISLSGVVFVWTVNLNGSFLH